MTTCKQTRPHKSGKCHQPQREDVGSSATISKHHLHDSNSSPAPPPSIHIHFSNRELARQDTFLPSPEDKCHSIWKKSYSGLLFRQRPCPLGCRHTSPGIPQRTMQKTANGPPMPTIATYHHTPGAAGRVRHKPTRQYLAHGF